MKIIVEIVSFMSSNAYLVYDEATREGVWIDLGGHADKLMAVQEKHEVAVQAILLTHGHFDHMMAVPKMRGTIPVCVFRSEADVIASAELNISARFRGKSVEFEADRLLDEGDRVVFGGESLEVIHTPGHSIGSCCFYNPEQKVLFTGDTLFYGSVGRTDLPTGDGDALVRSIREKIFTLPDDVVIYPGHGRKTSVAMEKGSNIYV